MSHSYLEEFEFFLASTPHYYEATNRRNFIREAFGAKYKKDYNEAIDKFKKMSKEEQESLLLSNKYGIRYLAYYKWWKESRMKKGVRQKDEIQYWLNKIFPNAEIVIDFFDHHLCHNISSYYSAPFEKALLVSIDGYGDGVFSKVYIANNGKIKEIALSKAPQINLYYFERASLGVFYSDFTKLLGFEPTSDEGKVEALAAFGNYNNEIYEDLLTTIKINKDTLSMDIVEEQTKKIFSEENLMSYLKRFKKEDIAAAIQKFAEDIVVDYLKLLVEKTGIDNICLSGG